MHTSNTSTIQILEHLDQLGSTAPAMCMSSTAYHNLPHNADLIQGESGISSTRVSPRHDESGPSAPTTLLQRCQSLQRIRPHVSGKRTSRRMDVVCSRSGRSPWSCLTSHSHHTHAERCGPLPCRTIPISHGQGIHQRAEHVSREVQERLLLSPQLFGHFHTRRPKAREQLCHILSGHFGMRFRGVGNDCTIFSSTQRLQVSCSK